MAPTSVSQQETKPSPQSPSAPVIRPATRYLGHSPEDYTALVTFISSIGIFGGAITFSVLFTYVGEGKCRDEHVPKVLGFASVCFLGAVLGCMPILIAMHTQKAVSHDAESVQSSDSSSSNHKGASSNVVGHDGQNPAVSATTQVYIKGPLLTFVRTQAALVSILMIIAFVCMFIAIILTGIAGPAIVGFLLVLFSIVGSICGYLNIPRSNTAIYTMQGSILITLIIVAVVTGAKDILDIRWENKCTGAFIDT